MLKRMLLIVAVLMVSAGLLFAAGAQEGAGDESGEAASDLSGKDLVTEQRIGNPDAEITLTMTVLPSSYWTTPYESRANYLESAYEEWARANPNVKIEVTTLSTNIGEAMVKLIEQARVGNAPDLVNVDSFFLPRFYDYLQPIGEYVSQEHLNDYFPFVRDGMTNNDGEVVAIWPETDVRGLYYRTDLVPEPPQTWDELVSVAGEISANQDLAGYLFPAGRGEGTTFSMLPFFWAQGGSLIDQNGRPIFAEGENRQYMLNILNFFERLIESGASPQKVTQFRTLGEFNSEVAARAVAMFPGGNWQKNMFYDILPEEEADLWEIAPFPQIREGINSSGSGGWAWGVFTEDEAKQEAAVSLVQSVYENPKWHEIAGPLPSWKSAYEEHPYFSENEYAQQFASFLEFSNARPGLPIYTTISSELQVAVSEVVTGQTDPETALDTAWNNVMREYEASN